MTIDSFSKCDCGAVTLYFTNGENNSILKSNLKKNWHCYSTEL